MYNFIALLNISLSYIYPAHKLSLRAGTYFAGQMYLKLVKEYGVNG